MTMASRSTMRRKQDELWVAHAKVQEVKKVNRRLWAALLVLGVLDIARVVFALVKGWR